MSNTSTRTQSLGLSIERIDNDLTEQSMYSSSTTLAWYLLFGGCSTNHHVLNSRPGESAAFVYLLLFDQQSPQPFLCSEQNREYRVQSLWFRNISKDSNRRKEDISLTISLTEVEGLEKISRKNRSSSLPRYIVSQCSHRLYMCDKNCGSHEHTFHHKGEQLLMQTYAKSKDREILNKATFHSHLVP